MANLFDRYVGLPFRDRGRDERGYDCWGLAQLIYREQLGIELPSYVEEYTSTADRTALNALIKGERAPWSPVTQEKARTFDLVLLRERPWHIGIVVGSGLMIHMPLYQTSTVEPYRTGRNFIRLEGLYRHEDRQ
ncbi:hypothetical protein BA190_27525 [Labrys sp. WJW]|uniref:C40 family peptidase n=1 Tax=Labrys sp. WJW TaxID=1737983 RepID=UPI0008297F35|nr:NlpC/P60 family protein [Labrys sp. WJW]OCC01715.1 hypothetical protein BA190_27525 [Labrys sp. WJW]